MFQENGFDWGLYRSSKFAGVSHPYSTYRNKICFCRMQIILSISG